MTRQSVLLAIVVTLLCGCSMRRLGLQNAETLARWRLDSVLDLTSQQEAQLSPIVTSLWTGFVSDLPAVVADLEELRLRWTDGLNLDDMNWAMARLHLRRQGLLRRGLDEAAPWIASLGEEQWAALEETLVDRNEPLEELAQMNEKEYQEERRERLFDSLEQWFPDLSEDQRQAIAQLTDRSHAEFVIYYEQRRETQNNFLAFLRSRPSPDQLRLTLGQWIDQPELMRSEKSRPLYLSRRRQLVEAVPKIDALMRPAQRAHAIKELDGWIADLRAVMKRS